MTQIYFFHSRFESDKNIANKGERLSSHGESSSVKWTSQSSSSLQLLYVKGDVSLTNHIICISLVNDPQTPV